MSLWDLLPIELQDIIVNKSVELCREEYLNQGIKKHNRAKKKQGRGLLTADFIRYVMEYTTEPMELLNWGFETEIRELEILVQPPVEMLADIHDYDYSTYYDEFLKRSIEYLENPENQQDWITPSEDQWLTMFTKLNNFVRRHKHLNILKENDGTGALYLWLEYQKDPDTAKKISKEKRHSLQSLGVRMPPIHRN
jgi:hypothetical protein